MLRRATDRGFEAFGIELVAKLRHLGVRGGVNHPVGVEHIAAVRLHADEIIVLDAGTRAGIALPVAGAAHQLYLLAQAAGRGAADDSTIATLLAPGRPD